MINKKKIILITSTLFIAITGIVGYYLLPNFLYKDNIEKDLGATVLMVPGGGTGATSFTAGECLVGNGSGAITTSACGGTVDLSSAQLGQIGDVSTTTLATGYVLKWSGTEWESVATSTLGIIETDPVWLSEKGSYLLTANAFTQAMASTTFVARNDWTTHDNYPAACGAGQYVSTIGDTLTCGTPAGTLYTAGSGLQLVATVFSLDMANANTWTALQTFGKATTTQLTVTTGYLGTILQTGTMTVTGSIDAGGATSLELPNGASGFTNTTGQVFIDTTSGQLRYNDGSATSTLINYQSPSFTYATSTAWSATTTIPLGVAWEAETWTDVRCFTDTGTTSVSFYDGTNRMNMFNASTTVNNITLSTNNTFTASEKRYVDIGTPVGSTTRVSCTIKKKIDAD